VVEDIRLQGRGRNRHERRRARDPSRAVTVCSAKFVRPAGYKPVSVPLRVTAIHLGRTLLSGSSDLPGSRTGRAAPPPLFGLAPRGVCHAGRITSAAVRSYRTISPLPHPKARRYIFCCAVREACAPPAVSRHAALWRPDFPLPFPEAAVRPPALPDNCRNFQRSFVRGNTAYWELTRSNFGN
jgi:hypothetical protein